MEEKPPRILVVEDHVGIRKLLTLELRLNGYEVITAQDGQEALNLIASDTPDIVLLDMLLPVMDGLEVLTRLRKTSYIPVIVISSQTEMAQKALKIGADLFIAKPFDPEKLLPKIKELLKG